MSAHTKGPWRPYKSGIHPLLSDGSNRNDGFAICGEFYGPDAPLNQALAASSPDLLAALREVGELIDGYVDIKDGANGPLPNDAMRAQQVIDEALARAEGRS